MSRRCRLLACIIGSYRRDMEGRFQLDVGTFELVCEL